MTPSEQEQAKNDSPAVTKTPAITRFAGMRGRILGLAGAMCLPAVLGMVESPSAQAQVPDLDYLLVPNLRGSYAFVFTGSVFLPAPYDGYNGPFVRNGRFVADGNGNLVATVVANYAGRISRDTFNGTYKVNPDGTFTYTIPNLALPPLPGVPNVFTFDGVMANGGKTCKVMLSGVSIAGEQQKNIGSVIYGEFLKQ